MPTISTRDLVLDLAAQDVSQAEWDELTRTMLNDEQVAQFLARSCNSDGGSSACGSGSCSGCGGSGSFHP